MGQRPLPAAITSLCASFVTAPGQALGLAVRNQAQRRIRISHMPGDVSGQMSMEIERILVKTGESIELPSAYIAWGRTWGDVLRPYRDWLTNTYKRAQPFSSWYWNGNWIENRYAHCLAPVHPTKATVAGAWTFDNASAPQTIEQLRSEMDAAFEVFGRRGLKPLAIVGSVLLRAPYAPCHVSRYRLLSPADAARLTRDVAPGIVIPCHYDLMVCNVADPQMLRTNLALYGMADRTRVLEHGVGYVFPE